jgi:hypothetical protein
MAVRVGRSDMLKNVEGFKVMLEGVTMQGKGREAEEVLGKLWYNLSAWSC